MRILLFGGTAEGHTLAQRLAQAGHLVTCCVATDYGRDVLEPQPNLTVRMGRMDQQAMEAQMGKGFDCVVDATHPYAAQVSGNILAAARAAGLPYERLLRPTQEAGDAVVRVGDSATLSVVLDGNTFLDCAADMKLSAGGERAQTEAQSAQPAPQEQLEGALREATVSLARRLYPTLSESAKNKAESGL